MPYWLIALDRHFPIRYLAWLASAAGFLLAAFVWVGFDHQNTPVALKELVQAAGLSHPNDITAAHIVHRTARHEVELLAGLLPFVAPGALLAAELPQQVFARYWPLAQAHSFQPMAQL